VLQLKALGIENVLRFDFLSPPPPESLARALELLYALGAISKDGQLTNPIGDRMAAMPLEPEAARMLIAATEERSAAEAITLAAMLSLQTVFTVSRAKDLIEARAPFAVYEGDSITLLNIHSKYKQKQQRLDAVGCSRWCRRHRLNERVLQRTDQVRQQLTRQMTRFGLPVESATDHANLGGTSGTDAIRRAIVGGYFANAAQHTGGGHYTAAHRQAPLQIHQNSVLWKAPAECVVFHETVYTAEREHLMSATKIEPSWLHELAPHFYEDGGPPSAPPRAAVEPAAPVCDGNSEEPPARCSSRSHSDAVAADSEQYHLLPIASGQHPRAKVQRTS